MTELGIFISRTVLAEAKTNTLRQPRRLCARLPGWALYMTPMLIFAIYTTVIGGINMRLHRLVVAKWWGFHVEMKDHCFLFLFLCKTSTGQGEREQNKLTALVCKAWYICVSRWWAFMAWLLVPCFGKPAPATTHSPSLTCTRIHTLQSGKELAQLRACESLKLIGTPRLCLCFHHFALIKTINFIQSVVGGCTYLWVCKMCMVRLTQWENDNKGLPRLPRLPNCSHCFFSF